jgi:hypothetical protein
VSIPTKSLEFLLESWRDHSKTGFHVTFLVSPEDQEFFKACPQGQRFTAVLVKLTDEDKPAPLPTAADLKREEAARAKRGAAEAKAHGITVPELAAQQSLPLPGPGNIGSPEQKAEQHAKNTEMSRAVAELPVAEPYHHKFPSGLCGLAVKWCQDPHFHQWLKRDRPVEWDDARDESDIDESTAKNFICGCCGIESRKELDTNDAAAATFRTDFMGPYAAQRLKDGIDAPSDAPF